MVTNLTNLTTSTNFYDIVKFNNDVTSGIFTYMLLLAIFFILLMMFIRQQYSIEESFLAAGFLCFAISIFFRAINLISFEVVLILFLITAASAGIVYWSKK